MRFETVWVHGTSIRIENPENLVRYNTYGWGTDVIFPKRQTIEIPGSWFHASLPTTLSLAEWEDTYLLSVEILFLAIHCHLDKVDIYDGSHFIESQSWRPLDGDWRFTKGNDDNWNKYVLDRPHRMFCGVGVSFHVSVDGNAPPFREDVRLIVASVGANFLLKNRFEDLATRVRP